MKEIIRADHSGFCFGVKAAIEKAEKAAEEGIVLLKNENILPISLSAPVALLGIGADKTVKGGIGSGDVNNRQNITIYEGMEESGIRITSRDWLDDYEHRYQKARLIWKEKILILMVDYFNILVGVSLV